MLLGGFLECAKHYKDGSENGNRHYESDEEAIGTPAQTTQQQFSMKTFGQYPQQAYTSQFIPQQNFNAPPVQTAPSQFPPPQFQSPQFPPTQFGPGPADLPPPPAYQPPPYPSQ